MSTKSTLSRDERRSIKARERIRKHALRILSRLKPLPAWEAGLSVEWKAAICRQFGSVEAFYNKLRDELVKQAQDPAPTMVIISSDGKAVWGWH